jgi:response regulator RpfG family c-di-GMP phosphodiesterase
MANDNYTFLVIENAPDVCEGIIRRMKAFENWHSLGYCVGLREAVNKTMGLRPDLLFLDWSLNGGSAFELLQEIQNTPDYSPYIIFNTGFQKDNPEIPQEIINKYKVDKYLIKPLWENLRLHLEQYLQEAEQKKDSHFRGKKAIWVETTNKSKVLIDLEKIVCICQHPTEPRSRNIYLIRNAREITVSLQWAKLCEILAKNAIDYFFTKKRSHLVIKHHIIQFEKPYVRLRDFHKFKIDVVKESIKEFERWLL